MRLIAPIAALLGCVLVAGTVRSAPSPASPAKKPAETPSAASKMMGGANLPGANAPTTTEIYADEAFFDSNKNVGIFTGHVKVTDPRFNLQSDKLTVYISKGENQGLEKAVAEGNVGVVRDRPDPNGGAPTHAVGRSETAGYIATTGDVELRGNPRVQQGENTHIATNPDTVMVLNQKGQLTTHGASRTEIRQQPKDDNDNGKPGEAATNSESKAPHKESETKGAKPKPQKP
jgi:lipopolysaccharide transport protein LptA